MITCALLWCFYQLFGLSFWRHPFTAEHPLLSKWWNAISPNLFPWTNKLIYILDSFLGELACFCLQISKCHTCEDRRLQSIWRPRPVFCRWSKAAMTAPWVYKPVARSVIATPGLTGSPSLKQKSFFNVRNKWCWFGKGIGLFHQYFTICWCYKLQAHQIIALTSGPVMCIIPDTADAMES